MRVEQSGLGIAGQDRVVQVSTSSGVPDSEMVLGMFLVLDEHTLTREVHALGQKKVMQLPFASLSLPVECERHS